MRNHLVFITFLIVSVLVGCGPFGGQALDDPGQNLHSPETYPVEEGLNGNISSDFTEVPSDQYPETKAVQIQEAKFIYVVDGGKVHVEEGDIPAQLEGTSPAQIRQAIERQMHGITQEQLDRLSPEQIQRMVQEQLGRAATPAPREDAMDATPDKPAPAPERAAPAEPTPAPQTPAPERAPTAETPAPAPERAAPTPAPEQATPAPAPEQTAGISEIEAKVIELTNVERRKNGLSDLQGDTQLSGVAMKKSTDMRQNNYFSHTSPTYGSPFDMMRDHGVNYSAAAENIAQGQRTPEEVVRAWMNSEGHRKNILNGNFTHIGVGYDANGHHWTQMFIRK